MANAETLLKAARSAFRAGDVAAAQELCRALLKTAPSLAEPWIILGNIELRHGSLETAGRLGDRAIALEPGNQFGWLLRCQALLRSGNPGHAFEMANRALATGNCPPTALNGFGAIFLELAKYSAALDLFARAVHGAPDNIGFLYNLAVAERACGCLEDAEHHFDQVIERNPAFHAAYVMRSGLRTQTTERNHVAEMEASIAAGLLHPEREIAIRFALGKECEDLGEYARAMNHLATGADVKRRRLQYDVKTDVMLIDSIVAAFGRERMDALMDGLAAADLTSDDPIFIVGLPRSGTTLVERIVAGHPAVIAAGELSVLPLELERAARRAGATRGEQWIERLSAIDWRSLGQSYSRLAREPGLPRDKRFIDKNPPNFLLCGVIRLVFPKAKIIALRRHPIDSCLALYRTLFDGAVYPYSYDLEDLADYYAAFRRLMLHWRETLPANFFLEVRYEDVVADLEGQSRRILSFLDLEWDQDVLRFHESSAPAPTASAAQVRRPIYSSSIESWRRYAEQLEPLRVRLSTLIPAEELGRA